MGLTLKVTAWYAMFVPIMRRVNAKFAGGDGSDTQKFPKAPFVCDKGQVAGIIRLLFLWLASTLTLS